MADKLSFSYDKEGDVLDISLGSPKEAVSHEISEDVFVRLDKKRKVVGFMVLNFEKRYASGKNSEPLPLEAEFTLSKSYL